MNITLAQIEEFLKSGMQGVQLKATQRKISGPKVMRNINRLNLGETPPPIWVNNHLIIEGHHRYIAGLIFGILPASVPWASSKNVEVVEWKDIVIDPVDWDINS